MFFAKCILYLQWTFLGLLNKEFFFLKIYTIDVKDDLPPKYLHKIAFEKLLFQYFCISKGFT